MSKLYEATVERLRNALKMHDENRTTIQSLASSVREFLREHVRLATQQTDGIVSVVPVVVFDIPDAHRVQFERGDQRFHIGPDYFDTKEEAEFLAAQFTACIAK